MRLSAIRARGGSGAEEAAQTNRMGLARPGITAPCQRRPLPTIRVLQGHTPILRHCISRVSARIAHPGELHGI